MCSASYIRLCRLAGKPTLVEIAGRAVKVALQQSENSVFSPPGALRARTPKFINRLESFFSQFSSDSPEIKNPKDNPFFQLLKKQGSLRSKKLVIRLATDTLMRSHQDSRGLDVPLTCRLCPLDTDSTWDESLRHIQLSHFPNFGALPPSAKRAIDECTELECEQRARPHKRIRLHMGAPEIQLFQPILDGITRHNTPIRFRQRPRSTAEPVGTTRDR